MKKNIFILFGVIVGIYIVFTFIDTSEYRVEKKIWRLQKDFDLIAEDPKAVPDRQVKHVVAKYRKLIKRHPKSRYVPQMYSSMGTLYVMNKDYDSARRVYGEVMTKFADSSNVASKALMDIGNTYMIENKVDRAVETYQRILDQHSRTEVGFKMPLFLAGLHRGLGRKDKVSYYLSEAEVFYGNLADDEEELEAVRINAEQALASVYIAQEKWKDAVRTLKGILYKYADSKLITPKRLSVITRALNMVCIGRLQDFDQAMDIYTAFIEDHPDHYLNSFLEKVLESLRMLKEYNLNVVSPG